MFGGAPPTYSKLAWSSIQLWSNRTSISALFAHQLAQGFQLPSTYLQVFLSLGSLPYPHLLILVALSQAVTLFALPYS